jgi:hypothetical protein
MRGIISEVPGADQTVSVGTLILVVIVLAIMVVLMVAL